MTLRRGFSVQPGQTALVIEDVITTGGSTREVINLLQEMGARVAGAGSIIDRSGGTADLGVPRVALATLAVKTWDPENCPLMSRKAMLRSRKPGSRTDVAQARAFPRRPMRRIRITVSYDGTNYHGWQIQRRMAEPGLPTIQGILEAVVEQIEGAPAHAEALRPNRMPGVHALAQVAAFDLANPIPPENLLRAMNRLLPRDIRVWSVEEAAPAFQPRFDARAKTYEYRIWRAEICPPFDRLYVHHHPYPLDERKMIELAPVLEGEHDFSAFAASDDADERGRSKVRRVFSSRLTRSEDRLNYRVRGSGFLKHMVRNIVGVLLEAGKGNSSLRVTWRSPPDARCANLPPAPPRRRAGCS